MSSSVLRDLVWFSDGSDHPSTTPDLRGRQVFDANGDDVGVIDDVLIDAADDDKVRFIRIAESGFNGIGARYYLVPIDAVVRINSARVRLDRDREQVADAPAYDPDRSEPQYYDRLYDYYQFRPYWEPGYAYPTDLYRP